MTKAAFQALVAATFVVAAAGCRCDPVTRTQPGQIGIVYEESGVTITQPDGIYDFDKVSMGVSKTMKMVITNNGLGNLTINSITPESGDQVTIAAGAPETPGQGVFHIAFENETIITIGETREFDITFNSPLESDQTIKTKEHQAVVSLALANATTEVAKVTLKGVSVSGACDLPRVIDFGAVATGDSFAKTVKVENISPIDTVASSGDITSNSGDHTNFEYSGESAKGQFPLLAGKSRDVIFVFRPTQIKDYLALVKMRAAEACPEITVRLIGSGVDSVLTWAPSPLTFGYVTPGLSVNADLTFSNQGFAPVKISNMKPLMGSNTTNEFAVVGADFVEVPGAVRQSMPDGSSMITPGTAKVTMTFKPSVLGLREATLTAITTLPKQNPIAPRLRGNGGGPDIDVKPAPVLNFGRVAYFGAPMGGGSAYFTTRKLSIQNAGTKPAMPDAAANLHLGKSGMGTFFEVSAKAGTAALDSEICVGVYDAVQGCLGGIAAPYDNAVGLVAGGASSIVDVPVRITPSGIGLKEWEVKIFSNDPDEPEVLITIKADAQVLPPCDYTLAPTNLNFGLVTPPDVKDLSFSIRNNATAANQICLISGLDMKSGSDIIYSLPAGPIDQKELAPGETMNVLVRAWPKGTVSTQVQNAAGAVHFSVSSPSQPERDVSLNASIATSCLTISPDDLDFGTVKKDCFSARKIFNIYNTCQNPVKIESFGMVAPAGEPAGGPNCPGGAPCPEFLVDGTPGFMAGTTIPAGNSMPFTFALKYRPINYGQDNGAYLIKVTQNAQIVDYIVTLRGTGDMQGLNTDVFRQDTKPKADILLIIDDSCSMSDKQTALSQNFASFIKYASTNGVDYQIGVTTTDLNRADEGLLKGDVNNPKILKPTTPNVEQLFKSKVIVGTSGGTEGTAEIAVKALTAPLITAENAGFLRPDAVLAVVGVTDAGDQSPQPATVYENQLRNIKGAQRASQFSYNIIGPFLPNPVTCGTSTCSGTSCYDDFTDVSKHQYLVNRFNGVKEEICAPSWATSLESVGKNAFGYRTNFFLTAEPQGGTVQVSIDGMMLAPTDPRGAPVWHYDATTNSVDFEPLFVPEPGRTLSVTYVVQCRTM